MKQFNKTNTALIVVDMQNDYCSNGFYMDKAGYDISELRKPIEPIAKVLSSVRSEDIPVIFTRQYRIPDGENDSNEENAFPETSLKNEPGWEIIPELSPLETERVFDKTTCSTFSSTDIHKYLQQQGISNLIFCGNTIDVCVHSTLRSAVDLGYKCTTISDCCGAVEEGLHKWSLKSIEVEGGVFGSVRTSQELLESIQSS